MNGLGNKKIMGRNIQRLMDRAGKTRMQVCDDLGIRYTTLTDWINGNTYPRIDKIELMANYFGVSKAELVEDQAEKASEVATLEEENRQLKEGLKRSAEMCTALQGILEKVTGSISPAPPADPANNAPVFLVWAESLMEAMNNFDWEKFSQLPPAQQFEYLQDIDALKKKYPDLLTEKKADDSTS